MYLLVLNSHFTMKYLRNVFYFCLYEPIWSMRFIDLINIMSTEPIEIIKIYLVFRMV